MPQSPRNPSGAVQKGILEFSWALGLTHLSGGRTGPWPLMHKIPPENLMRFSTMETARLDLEWWTMALYSVAGEEKAGSEISQAFRKTVAAFVPEAATLPFADCLLLPLTTGQKAVVMGLLDSFTDVTLCNSDYPEGWVGIEESFLLMVEPLEDLAKTVDGALIDQGWMNLRAEIF